MLKKVRVFIWCAIFLLFGATILLIQENLNSAHPIYQLVAPDGTILVEGVDSIFYSEKGEEYIKVKLTYDLVVPNKLFAFTYSDDNTAHLWHIVTQDSFYEDSLWKIDVAERITSVKYFSDSGADTTAVFASCSSLEPWRIITCEGETLIDIKDGVFFVPSEVRVLEEGFLSVLGANGQYKTIDP